MDKQKTLLPSR